MKRLLMSWVVLVGLQMAALAGGTVMVNTNTGVILWPTNFAVANGLSGTDSVGVVTLRVAALEALTNGTYSTAAQYILVSNRTTTLEGQTNKWGTTNEIVAVSDRVTVLEAFTNGTYATTNQHIVLSNRVTTLEGTTMPPYSNGNITVTGTVTAVSFVGNGSGLAGVTAAVTGGVNEVIVGTVTNTGNITFYGARVSSAAAGSITFTNFEYVSKTIVPASATWDMFFEMPRDETITLVKLWAQTDAYNVTFSVVEAESNAAWRVVTTNLADVFATSDGLWATNFTDNVIEAGHRWGIRVTDLDARTMGLTWGLKIAY